MRVLSVGLAFVSFLSRSESGVVVVKRVRALRDDDSARALLVAEGDVLARLAHSNAAPELVARGEDDFGPWIAMEFLDGVPLRGFRDARAAFESLARVHEARVIHGDITPENVIVNGERAWLVDFTPTQTTAGAFAGTIAFTSPEQARGEAFDERADIFSLAASIVFAEHARQIASPRNTRDLPLAAQLVIAGEKSVDASFVALAEKFCGGVLARCLAFDRAARPPSARAVLAEVVLTKNA